MRDRLKRPERYILRSCRNRAVKAGMSFDIEEKDVVIPEYCPVLGIKLESGVGKGKWFLDASPSIDRIDPTKGYTKGNVQVISWRANALKRDGTIAEMRAIVAYMERHL